jgi:uncharacterized repeat protein (TIGR03803 family)
VTDVIGRRALSSFTVVLIVLLQGFVCQVGAQTLTVLHNFSGADGANPIGGLILAPDDYIYGTTVSGDQSGTTNYPCSGLQSTQPNPYLPEHVLLTGTGCGVVFQMSTAGSFSLIFEPDFPVYPMAPVVWTQPVPPSPFDIWVSGAGCTSACSGTSGARSFEVTGVNTDGPRCQEAPSGAGAVAIAQGANGIFYSTTYPGPSGVPGAFYFTGSSTFCDNVEWITSGSFAGSGSQLVQGSDGSFYGVSPTGGANGKGAIFKITLSGIESTLYSFANGADGQIPLAALTFGSDGNLYGTTTGNCLSYAMQESRAENTGTIFRMTTSGALTTLYIFSNSGNGPQCPSSPLLQGNDGSFYGTTAIGGATSGGTIFNFSLPGTMSTLYSFPTIGSFTPPINNTSYPTGNIAIDSGNSTIYGGTALGGSAGFGQIYSFSFPPIVNLSISGKATLSLGVTTYQLSVTISASTSDESSAAVAGIITL